MTNQPARRHTRAYLCVVVLAIGAAGALTACSNAQAPKTTISAVDPDEETQAEINKANIAVSCAVISSVRTTITGAESRRYSGEFTDAQYAAVINMTPYSFRALQRNSHAGLNGEIRQLLDAIPESSPTITGAIFNPQAEPFRSAIDAADKACQANNSPAFILGTTGGG